jgi:putative membrane protein
LPQPQPWEALVGFILKILVNAAALWVAAKIVPGIEVDATGTLLLAALVFGLVNTFIKPVAQLLALPVTILTLGLFALVVNALLLWLTAALVPGFSISGFLAALIGAIIVSLVGAFLGGITDKKS